MFFKEQNYKNSSIIHGSIPPVTILPRATPGTSPALRGWGIVRSGLYPGGGVGQIGNRSTRLLRQFNEPPGAKKKTEYFIGKSVLMTLHHKHCVRVCEAVSI